MVNESCDSQVWGILWFWWLATAKESGPAVEGDNPFPSWIREPAKAEAILLVVEKAWPSMILETYRLNVVNNIDRCLISIALY